MTNEYYSVVQEKKELDERIAEYYNFFGTSNFRELNLHKKELVSRQYALMKEYSHVLDLRIAGLPTPTPADLNWKSEYEKEFERVYGTKIQIVPVMSQATGRPTSFYTTVGNKCGIKRKNIIVYETSLLKGQPDHKPD